MTRRPEDVQGIACATGAAILFSVNDMAIKLLIGDYPLHQIIFARSVIALSITLIVFVPLDGGYRTLRTRRLGLHMLRSACVVTANLTFFTALSIMSLAEATAIFFVAPLLITILSVPLLGEKVGIRRLSAVTLGLAGVILIIRPASESFQIAAVLPLVGACAYAFMQIITRKLGLTEKASTMTFYAQICFVLMCSGFGLAVGDGRHAPATDGSLTFLLGAWVWPTAGDVWVLGGLGLVSSVAAWLISQAYRLGEAGVIAPFEYTVLPMALFWGILIWGEWPELWSWGGISMICVAGIYVFLREAALKRPNAIEQAMPRNR